MVNPFKQLKQPPTLVNLSVAQHKPGLLAFITHKFDIFKINSQYISKTKSSSWTTSSTKVVLEARWGICPAPSVLRQYTVVFA